MPFKIAITADAARQYRSLPVREQRILKAAIQSRLEHKPTKPTKAIKRLRPNPSAKRSCRSGIVLTASAWICRSEFKTDRNRSVRSHAAC